jgi:RNA recognition motif-containing protein
MMFMKDYQPVRAKILTNEEGQSKGQGFIHLKTSEYARLALQELDQSELYGRKLHLNYAFNNKQ